MKRFGNLKLINVSKEIKLILEAPPSNPKMFEDVSRRASASGKQFKKMFGL